VHGQLGYFIEGLGLNRSLLIVCGGCVRGALSSKFNMCRTMSLSPSLGGEPSLKQVGLSLFDFCCCVVIYCVG